MLDQTNRGRFCLRAAGRLQGLGPGKTGPGTVPLDDPCIEEATTEPPQIPGPRLTRLERCSSMRLMRSCV